MSFCSVQLVFINRQALRFFNNANLKYSTRTAFRNINQIPGPKGLPYFGTYFNYKLKKWPVTDYHITLQSLYERYGSIVREVRCGEPVVHIFKPEHAQVIFRADGKVPYIKPLMETTQVYRQEREMSPGLGNTNGKPWIQLRTAVSPLLLRPEQLADRTLHVIDEVATEAVKWLGTLKEVWNLDKRISLLQIESGARVVTGKRLGFLEGNGNKQGYRMYEANRNVFQLTAQMKYSLPVYRYFPALCPNFKKLSSEEDKVFGTGQRWLDEAWTKYNKLLEKDKEKAVRRWPVLHYLSQRTEITKQECDIIALGIMFDGLSTTSPTLISLLYCLANNEQAQTRAADEARKALRLKGGLLDYDIVASNLTYIRACIKETMRLHTITTDISRITQKELVVDGYIIPAKTVIEINTHSLFRDKNFIPSPPDVEKYAPERWLRGEGTGSQAHPFLVLPFGHGTRMCAGRRFAEMEIMIFLVRLLSQYRMSWLGDTKLRHTYETLLYPKGSLGLMLKKRS